MQKPYLKSCVERFFAVLLQKSIRIEQIENFLVPHELLPKEKPPEAFATEGSQIEKYVYSEARSLAE